MTMFPMPMPELPAEMVEAAMADPEGFADAMTAGMDAMTAVMGDGGTIADAFEALGDAMGPLMEDLGISPEVFEAMGDAIGAGVGGGMHMAPTDATPADMGAIMQDGLVMMMPPGAEVPPVISDAMGEMGNAMGDAGASPQDVASEMMAPPGDDMYPLPTDADGNAIVDAGDPSTCPADACQPPQEGGAIETTAPDMMPPEGGYEHVAMEEGTVLPEPFDFSTATNVSQGLNPDGTDPLTNVQSEADSSDAIDVPVLGDEGFQEAAPVDLNLDSNLNDGGAAGQSADNDGGTAADAAVDLNLDSNLNDGGAGDGGGDPAPGNNNDDYAGYGGGAAWELDSALGGDSTDGMADNGPDQNDTSVGAAMDSATEQGGGHGSGASQDQDFGNTGESEESNESQDVDSSTGMG